MNISLIAFSIFQCRLQWIQNTVAYGTLWGWCCSQRPHKFYDKMKTRTLAKSTEMFTNQYHSSFLSNNLVTHAYTFKTACFHVSWGYMSCNPGGFLVQRSIRGRAAEMSHKISLLVNVGFRLACRSPLRRVIIACCFRVTALSGHAALAFSSSGIAPELNRIQLSAICRGGQSGKVIDLLAWCCLPLGHKRLGTDPVTLSIKLSAIVMQP